jgi:peptide/nickel transport system substrate-binding protein
MNTRHWGYALPVLAGLLALPLASPSVDAQTPKKGGILKFVVPDEPPSFDGHRETTFALIHPIAPFYSTLIRVEPENPNSGNYVCDLCTEMPEPADGGKTYTFKIRKDAKFHDGTAVTAADVHATFQRIVFPPQGVSSARKAQFSMVESVTNPSSDTVVFKLKHPSGAFIPALRLLEGEAGRGPALVREERAGLGPLHFRGAPGRRLHQRQAQPQLPPQGQALPRRLPGDLR